MKNRHLLKVYENYIALHEVDKPFLIFPPGYIQKILLQKVDKPDERGDIKISIYYREELPFERLQD